MISKILTWIIVKLYQFGKFSEGKNFGVGVPNKRDPESPCDYYAPRKPQPHDWTDCDSDGHYLCKGCAHLNRAGKEEENG